MLEFLYRSLTLLAGPAVRLLLEKRAARGKEDPARRHERLGRPALARPPGRLVWLHGASVGESLAILPLVDRLLALDPDVRVMVTTGTVTSAALMARRLPAPRAFHQYMPVDLPGAVNGFLDHWHPDLVIWIESEFWPNILSAIRRRGIACALVNARISQRSFQNWRRFPRTARRLLSVFQLALAQTTVEAGRLTELGIRDSRAIGNLKYSAAPLPADKNELAVLQSRVADRPVWCFASSHPGEEAIAMTAHRQVMAILPDALLILVPRHPDRGAVIADEIVTTGLSVARRSTGKHPERESAVFLVDTLGELGLMFRLATVTAMGGSFMPVGGHNPIEPALLGSALIQGPHMFNFAEVDAEMQAADAALSVTGGEDLAAAVLRLLRDPAARNRQAAAAKAVAERNAGAIDRVMAALAPLLAQAGIGT